MEDLSNLLTRQRIIWINLEYFKKQSFGTRQVLLTRAAPPIAYFATQDGSEAKLRIDRSRVDLQCLLENSQGLLVGCGRERL